MSQLVAYGTSDNEFFSCQSTVYATARTATSATYKNISDSAYDYFMVGQVCISGPTTYVIDRGILFFDTSSIPINAIITSAVLSLRSYGGYHRVDNDFDVVIQSGQPTYPSDPVQLTDYNYLYYQPSLNLGSLNTASWNSSSWNDIALNANGINWISRGGITKYCLRSSKDISGTAPGLDVHDYVAIYAQQKGAGYIPYLTINYTSTPAVYGTMNN